MIKIHPAQLLNELMQNLPKDIVITIEVRKLNRLVEIARNYNINMDDCYFDDIEYFVKQIIFNKHQSILTYDKIYLLNCYEIRNRIEAYCNMYGDVDISFISKNWEDI